MVFRGTVENGRVVLDDGSRLPEGASVDVTVRRSRGTKSRRPPASTDPLMNIAKRAIATGISDMSDEHDHYAYGTPKRFSKPAKRGAARGSRQRTGSKRRSAR